MNEAERELDHLLRIVADHVDLDHCRRVDERYRRALSWEEVDLPPLVVQAGFGSVIPLPEPWSRFRHYPYRETFAQPAAMLQNMLLERVVPGLILKDDNPLAVRNNHGVIQLASALTGRWRQFEDDYPWIERLDSIDQVREVAGGEGLDPAAGLLPRVLEALAFYRTALDRYPACREAVQISLPDLQGPMDTAEQLWGSDIHYAFADEPELLPRLLARIVDATVAGLATAPPLRHQPPGTPGPHPTRLSGSGPPAGAERQLDPAFGPDVCPVHPPARRAASGRGWRRYDPFLRERAAPGWRNAGHPRAARAGLRAT